MAKFYGVIGFAAQAVASAPGVFVESIVEKNYYGDVLTNARQIQEDQLSVNYDLAVNNSISIVADAFLDENFFAIRYINWMGANWTVSDVTVQRPRLILRLGGVYNGPVATGSPNDS